MSKFLKEFIFLYAFAIAIFATSCKTSKKTVEANSIKLAIESKSSKELSELLKKNEFDFEWISAKFSAEANLDSNKNSLTVNMRSRKDSVLWFSVSAGLGIEVARVLITRDSVKMVSRFNSSYFLGDYNYLSKLLHADLDFDLIQSLLVGNSVEFYDDERLRTFAENGKYALSTTRRKKSKKVLSKNKELNDPIQIIWLEPESFKISRILFKDFDTERTFDGNFSNFNKIDSMYFPYSATYSISAEKKIYLKTEYSKLTLNTPQTFPFNIPEKYERIIY